MKSLLIFICLVSLSTTQAKWYGCFNEFNSLFSLVKKSKLKAQSIELEKLKNIGDLDLYLENKKFITAQRENTLKAIKQHNAKVKELLFKEALPKAEIRVKGKRYQGAVTKEQAQTLYEDMINTPCVKNDFPYQRPGVSLGYCFGRAIIASIHALKRSVHPRAMRKIWVTGEMSGNWGHHVAFMVRGEEGEWFVIDNVTGLVTHDEWIKKMEGQYQKNRSLMFFATRPERFGPESGDYLNSLNLFNVRNSKWSEFDKESDYYRGFFKDFFEWFDDQDEVIPFID